VRTSDYVEAARGAGASAPYLIWRHILPHTGVVVRTQAALLIPEYMLAEITLSFLGLGVAEPIPSWGSMLQPIQQYPVLRNDWWMLVPALVMIPIFWAFGVLADQPWNRIQFPLI
jgi:peptide/nickel transport system permease protein